MSILSTNYKLFTKLALISLLFCLGLKNANAAFVITSGSTYTVGVAANYTVSGAPTGTASVTYSIAGSAFGTSTSGTSYTVSATASITGTYALVAKAYNSSGTLLGTTATVNGSYYPPAPSATGSANCGPGTPATLTALGGNPAGGNYLWYAASTGGTALQNSTSTTYTTPVISASTTYYVSYSQGGYESTTRTAVTATIGSQPAFSVVPTSPSSGFYLSYPFTGNANDVSGNANTGIPENTPTLTTDRFNAANSAYSFNGSSQYIATTKATSTSSVGPLNYSISVWFKTSTAGGMLVGFGSSQTGSSGSYDRHIYMSNAGQLYFGIYPGSIKTISSSTSINYADGKWHHVIATESTTSGATLFVDGAIVAADPTMNSSQPFDGYWRVGYDNINTWTNQPTNYYFTGSLDDIAIYTSALTASQIYTIYGAGSPPTCIGSPLLLQANSVSGVTYAWTGPNSFSSTQQNPTVSNSATTAMAGTYTCTITNTTTGCSSAISVTAVVNALPASSFTATATVAANANATITNTATNAASSTYAWDFNGGTIVSGSGAGPYTITWSTAGTKTVTQTVTNASGCTAVSTQTVTVTAGTYGTYAYVMPLTLKTTSLGISSDLTNFPFLVTITDPSLVVSSGSCNNKVQFPNGPNYDFAFVDGNTGTEDYYQIESYNQATGTLLVWVQLPTLSHTTNNTLSFYYGSASAPASPAVVHSVSWSQSTWGTDYKAVYHFNEASYTGTAVDATSNGNTGTMTGMSAASQVTGIFDKAYNFAGSQKITANAVTISGTFTLSAWINLNATGIDQKVMTNQGSAGGGSGGYKLGIFNNNYPETESGSAGDRGSTPLPTALSASQWYYVQGVYSGSTLTTYVNGVQYEVLSTTTSPTSSSNYLIGVGEGGNVYYFNGLISESRVSNVAKTTDWLTAEYQNQLNPANLTSNGSVTGFLTNAQAIKGGITYNTADGVNYTYTFNSATTSGTPPNDGTASFAITGNVSIPTTATIYGLTINSSSNQFNLNGQTLNVGCNIVNNGTITNTSSTASNVIFNGTGAAQSYTGTSTSVATMDNVTVNNSSSGKVTITGGGLNVTNTITLTKGSITVDNAGGGALTLKSTATQTATVAAITQGAIIGSVNVERYLTGGSGYRGYRLMSSPVYAAAVSPNNVYSLNYLSNSAYITGSSGTGGGFDKTGNPTLYLYREDLVPNNFTFISGNFSGISALNNSPTYNYYVNGGSTTYNIPVGNGYMFFFRGNRASATVTAETTTSYVPVTVTLSASGTLNQGQFTVHNWYTPSAATIGYTGTGTGATTNSNVRGFNLVGNPYASSIDWEQFNTTSSTTGIYGVNIGTTIYEFNPLTKNYDTYQKGGSHTNSGTRTIASGQGFFVLASSANPQLIFNESAKTATQNTGATLFMSKQRSLANGQNPPHMRLQLALDSVNTDDTYIEFGSTYSTTFIEDEDAAYRAGQGVVDIASVSTNNVALAINKMPFPGPVADTIPLKVYAAAQGLYALNQTEFEGVPQLYEVWLMDRYKKDSLDLRANNKYLFDIYANDTTSYGAKRFYLILRQNPALGVHLLSFTAAKVTQGTQTAWKVENEQDYTTYTVQRSIDNGVTYTLLDTLQSTGLGTYSFLDTSPVNGIINLYRLKQVDLNGAITYSAVIAISYGNAGNSLDKNNISIYPNPAVGTLNVAITQGLNTTGSSTAAAASPNYSITIVNALGAVVQTATATQTTWTTDVSKFITGSYIIQVIDNNSKIVVGKSTFIKL